jgi:hypothetical protein
MSQYQDEYTQYAYAQSLFPQPYSHNDYSLEVGTYPVANHHQARRARTLSTVSSITINSPKLTPGEILDITTWAEAIAMNARQGFYPDPNKVIVECIAYLEKFTKLTGPERKNIAIQICGKILDDASGLDISTNLSSTIDLIVDLTKGKYDINKIEKAATGCLGLMFGAGKKYAKK